jgi:coenzyme F420-reducing hydrogenase gamma subunit
MRVLNESILVTQGVLCVGRSACLEALITWGADVDYDIPHLGTPLYIACISSGLQCTQKLLDGGQ